MGRHLAVPIGLGCPGRDRLRFSGPADGPTWTVVHVTCVRFFASNTLKCVWVDAQHTSVIPLPMYGCSCVFIVAWALGVKEASGRGPATAEHHTPQQDFF